MKLLTLARDLKRRKARERQSMFVAEGVRAVEELLRSSLEVVGILSAPQAADAPRGSVLIERIESTDLEHTIVSELEFRSAAETESPQGMLAIGRVPDRKLDRIAREGNLRMLVLDAVQDPGNIGTMLRTAAAFGVDATVALPGTVDLWNPKVVRAAMGAHFQHFALHATAADLFELLDGSKVQIIGSDVAGENIDSFDPPNRLALVVGNEGAGLSDQIRAKVARTVAVPIESGVESLNVAVATGILLHRLRI
jgi:TrmH family RNA methyltransferase